MFETVFAARPFAARAAILGMALALVTLGAAPVRAETAEQQCSRLVHAEISWNRAGSRQWDPRNVRALCSGSRDPFATIACFNKGVRRHDDWRRAIDDCTARRGAQVAPAQDDGFAGYARIQNRWRPDTVIHAEHANIAAGVAPPGWHSARWSIEPVPGTPYVRIRNMWKSDQHLHIEHGPLQAGPIQPGWHSAQWRLEAAPDGYVRIRNRWQSDRFIHVEHGRVKAGQIGPGWHSAMWLIR